MAKISIRMKPGLKRRAFAEAANLGISYSEYVRRLLADDLGHPKLVRKVDVSTLFNLVKDGPETNIARDKDKMIGEAVWDEHLRSIGRNPRHRRTRAPAN